MCRGFGFQFSGVVGLGLGFEDRVLGVGGWGFGLGEAHPPSSFDGSEFMVQGSGCRVFGSGRKVQGLWFIVWGLEFRVQGSGIGV